MVESVGAERRAEVVVLSTGLDLRPEAGVRRLVGGEAASAAASVARRFVTPGLRLQDDDRNLVESDLAPVTLNQAQVEVGRGLVPFTD